MSKYLKDLINMDKSSIFYLISGLISITGLYFAINSKVLGKKEEYVSIETIAKKFVLPMTIAVLGSVLMFLSLKLDKVEDISVTSQISEIENMQESVKNLGLFLEYKKSEIYETNKLINELKDEQAIFDSIAKVDEQTIEHILAIHQKANRLNRWKETGIAFILGIISSIFGGHILESIKKK